MPMTAKECRVRANECIELARSADTLAHAQLRKMADAWLKLAEADIERHSEATPRAIPTMETCTKRAPTGP
jgi:hypothetical protein